MDFFYLAFERLFCLLVPSAILPPLKFKNLMGEISQNPSTKWRVCKNRHIYDQQTDPDEKEYLDAAKNFGNEEAANVEARQTCGDFATDPLGGG